MSLATTTLSAAVAVTDTSILLTSITNVTTPSFQSGSGIVYLYIEQEWMQVLGVGTSASAPVQVKRGMLGSCAVPHLSGTPVLSGLPSDFPGPIPISIKSSQDFYPNIIGFSANVATAATIVASGYFFHTTGTVAVVNITAPAGGVAGGGLPLDGSQVNIVFDGSAAGLTWTAAGNIAVAGTATTAASMVTFTFDQVTGKWHPSRLA